MALLRLNLGQQQRPSPVRISAEQVSTLVDAGIATAESEKPVDPPMHAAGQAGTGALTEPPSTAPATIDEPKPSEPPRQKAAYQGSASEPPLKSPVTVADRIGSLLDTSAPTGDPQGPRMLAPQNAVPAVSAAGPADFAVPATTTVPEDPRPLPEHDVHPAASGSTAEPHFAMMLASIAAEGPGALRRQPAVPPASTDPEAPQTPQQDPLEVPIRPGFGPAFTGGGISLGLFPARGFLYSLLGHGIAIAALLLLWPKPAKMYDPPQKWELTMISKDALYLPALGGGDSGGPQHGATAKSQTPPSLSVAALSKLGVSYPGRQAIISNPPHPTNRVQTLLQPELPNPPELTKFVSLPNVVRLAERTPTPQPGTAPDSPKTDTSLQAPVPNTGTVTPTIPQLRALAPAVISAPKLSLPMAAPAGNPVMQAAAAPPVTPAPPAPAQVRALPGSSAAKVQTLIALSVAPAPPDPAPKVPAAEAHGQFAVVALPHLAVSELGIGSAAESETPEAAGAGANPKSGAHNATGAGTLAAGASNHPAAGGNGSVAGPGPGATDGGAGRNTAGAAGGGMTIRGAAFGSGGGTGKASGAGAGAGPAPGAFAGMTIQGGEWPNGMPAGVTPQPPAKPMESGSYGLTVVSTGNSGSGLGDFGVFYNEPVFTVYISMTTPSDSAAPSWTLVYAALHPGESAGGKITPPFPSKKETPAWPADLLDRYRNQLCVVYMVIDESGKVLRAKSMESPNVDFVAPLLAALNDWKFRPATVNGKPVAVRGLLGVPISARPVPTPASASNADKTPITENGHDPFSRN
jgi:hypothetical protein